MVWKKEPFDWERTDITKRKSAGSAGEGAASGMSPAMWILAMLSTGIVVGVFSPEVLQGESPAAFAGEMIGIALGICAMGMAFGTIIWLPFHFFSKKPPNFRAITLLGTVLSGTLLLIGNWGHAIDHATVTSSSDALGISFAHPRDWSATKPSTLGQKVKLRDGSGGILVIRSEPMPSWAESSINDYSIEDLRANALRSAGGANAALIDEQQGPIAGFPGYYAAIKTNAGGIEAAYFLSMLIEGKRLLTLVCGGPYEKLEHYNHTCVSVIDSLKIK